MGALNGNKATQPQFELSWIVAELGKTLFFGWSFKDDVMTYDVITYDVMKYDFMKYDDMTFDIITFDVMTHDVKKYDVICHNILISHDVINAENLILKTMPGPSLHNLSCAC